MVSPAQRPKSSSRLAERLAAAQRRNFVGRGREIQTFREALLADEPGFAVLFVHGPGGIGKTTLLDEFIQIAAENSIPAFRLDGRNIEPSPPGFTIALNQEMGIEQGASPLDTLSTLPRSLLLIDTAEVLAPIEAWLRDQFLPQIPNGTLVVIAGRNQPAPEWRSSPGWNDLLRVVSLRNFRPDECRRLFEIRRVPEQHQQAILEFTHGHPLALSLVADVIAQGDDLAQFDPRTDPNLVKLLLDRFASQVPSDEHRRALEVCAHMRVTTEDILSNALGAENAPALFEWLRGLSFIEQGHEGLFPHDLAREVLEADLRWRSPQRFIELHRQVREDIVRRIQILDGMEQQRAFFDLLFLHRNNAVMSPLYDWASLGTVYADRSTIEDFPAIIELIREFEGDESARIAEYWIERQPQAFASFRSASASFLGFSANLILPELRQEDIDVDPAVAAAWRFTRRHAPIRAGEVMLHHRFAMGRHTYQNPSPVSNLVSMRALIDWTTTPRLAWNIISVADPKLWHPEFTYLYQQRAPEADFSTGGRQFGAFAHDWRTMPVARWFELMEQRELSSGLHIDGQENLSFEPLVVLSQPEFDDAVRRALRDLNKPQALATNPLLRSRLVMDAGEDTAGTATLRTLLLEAAESLRLRPKEERLYRALDVTYFHPAATQELAAERLGLPFSTYRYHLTTGIERLTATLWRRELYGPEE